MITIIPQIGERFNVLIEGDKADFENAKSNDDRLKDIIYENLEDLFDMLGGKFDDRIFVET